MNALIHSLIQEIFSEYLLYARLDARAPNSAFTEVLAIGWEGSLIPL